MLQSIRNNAQGVLVWIVVGLIVVSFALFGLGSYLSGTSKIVAASVNGVEITNTALTRAYQNYQERLRQMFGEQYNPEMFGTARVKNEVLQGLITQEVINQMLHEQGYKASSEQIFEKIKQYEAFQEGGVFSAKRYKEVLSLQGINGEAFENDLSRDIASQQLRTAISTSAFLTEEEKKRLSALENQKRKVGYFEVTVKPYRNLINVSDEDIQSHYDKNSQSYLTAEKVQLDYIELNLDDVAALQDVTDEMVKQHYDSSPESYKASDDAAAKKTLTELRQKIMQGADFSSLAKKYSQDKGSSNQGGDLGYLTRGVEEKFDEVVFSLKVGEVSEVIKSKQGFQLIKLDDIRKGDPEERKVSHILIKPDTKLKSLAEVKDSIKKELKYKQAGKVFFDDADKLNNLTYETPDSLEPAAEALGLKIRTSTLMTRKGNGGIFSNPKVLSAAFSDDVLKRGRNSELLELSDSQLVVLRIKEHKPASVKPLSSVKVDIKNYLLQEKASKKAQEVAVDVLARVKNNESIKSIQKSYPEIKWNDANWITRKPDAKSTLPGQINNQVFAMPKPSVNKTIWDKVVLASGDQAVIGLFDIEEVSEGKIDNDKITQLIGNADYESFIQYLKSQADITISNTALDSDEGKNQ